MFRLHCCQHTRRWRQCVGACCRTRRVRNRPGVATVWLDPSAGPQRRAIGALQPMSCGGPRPAVRSAGRVRSSASWLATAVAAVLVLAQRAISAGVSGGLSPTSSATRKTSRKRIVAAVMPTVTNGSRSIRRTRRTQRRARGYANGLPDRITRFGRMVQKTVFSICSSVVASYCIHRPDSGCRSLHRQGTGRVNASQRSGVTFQTVVADRQRGLLASL